MSRLIAVSNRVVRAGPGGTRAGGLAVGLIAALKETGGLWFGWSGEVTDAPSDEPKRFSSGGISYATIDLSPDEYTRYYQGFSNSTLWPLFHYRLDLMEFRADDYRGYRITNERFARVLKDLIEPDDIIWVHDYHLIPMAEELRRLGVRNRIGFFLHVPFPSHQVMVVLPQHREIVSSLSAYDVVGFQSGVDLRTFSHYIMFETSGVFEQNGSLVRAFRHVFHAAKFPIGIDSENVASMARSPRNEAQRRRLVESLNGRALVIGVDRLDYSKGLIQRFQAFDKLLEDDEDIHGKVVMMQIAPPSREDVAHYAEIRSQLQNEAGRINGNYAEFDWVPIRYLNRGFSRDVLTKFFRMARVGLVTPLRDGMNLVAKEYIAAQDPDDPGVLVLSRFCGAAEQLTSALIVNPYDVEMVAATLGRALEMSRKERRARWQAAMDIIRKQDIHFWSRSFLETLSRAPFKL